MGEFRMERAAGKGRRPTFWNLLGFGRPSNRYMLRGRIVTMNPTDEVIDDGLIGIVGTEIRYVGPFGAEPPKDFAGASVVETQGTIFPGMIELHNHPTYNAVPLWEVPKRFGNREEWRRLALYERRVKRPAALLAKNPEPAYPRSVVRFVECRSLLGGVTTFQGVSAHDLIGDETYYKGLVRNVEFPENGWPQARGRIPDFESHEEADKSLGRILGDRNKPYLLHLSEGTDQAARDAFLRLRRPDGSWLLGPNITGIHATGLRDDDFDAMAGSAGIVWSPLSNLLLYGQTTDIARAKRAGVALALGSDWGPSGSKNLLGELKIAKIVSDHAGRVFSDRDLVRMVTLTPARMINWDAYVGSIEVGKRADLTVVAGQDKEAYRTLIDADEADIVAVVIDGVPRVGRASVLDPHAAHVELIRVGGQDLVLDLVDETGNPLGGISLNAAIALLEYGLAHLPELAERAGAHLALLERRPGTWMLDLEIDDAQEPSLASMAWSSMRAEDVDRMTLDPITHADDADWFDRLRANPNLPDWLKTALP